MDYLQYDNKFMIIPNEDRTEVLNLIINGLPSIQKICKVNTKIIL